MLVRRGWGAVNTAGCYRGICRVVGVNNTEAELDLYLKAWLNLLSSSSQNCFKNIANYFELSFCDLSSHTINCDCTVADDTHVQNCLFICVLGGNGRCEKGSRSSTRIECTMEGIDGSKQR